MSPPRETGGGPGWRGDALYFFLSYARLAPLPRESYSGESGEAFRTDEVDSDPEIDKLFSDLDAEVRKRVGGQKRIKYGFYDRQISFNEDPRRSLAEALGRAQVFIPLYSPSYLTTSWTRRELNAFRARMDGQGQEPEAHILPVLWTPVPAWTASNADQRALDRARSLYSEVSEYCENGLRALCLVRTFADAYTSVVGHLADRVVALTHDAMVSPGPAVDLDSLPHAQVDDPSFIVTALTSTMPRENEATSWHPYTGRQELPVVDHVVRTAERLGLSVKVVSFGQVSESSADNPALAVVDPRILQERDGEAELVRAFRDLPQWVRPLVVGNSEDPPLDTLARRAQSVLTGGVVAEGRGVERVDGPEELEARLPSALVKARQTYLKHGPYAVPTAPRPRLRLHEGGYTTREQESDGER
jgi:hypothetical protein